MMMIRRCWHHTSSKALLRPVIEGTGEWKAGQGRISKLKHGVASLQTVPRAGVPTTAPEPGAMEMTPEEEAMYRGIDHESVRNAATGEWGGYQGAEPTRNGDWEHKGRVSDF